MNSLTNIGTNALQGFMEDLSLVRVPSWWQSPWFLLLVLVLLAILIVFGRRYYLRRFGKPEATAEATTPPGEPAHLIALRQLEELRRKMDELGVYRLATECSWVLRRFIEARFRLRIVYQTTREFLEHAQTHSALEAEPRASLGRYLGFCDLVKFAREGATREEMLRLLDFAVAFVQACAKTGTDATAGQLTQEHKSSGSNT